MTQRKSRAHLKRERRIKILVRLGVMAVMIVAVFAVFFWAYDNIKPENVSVITEDSLYNPGPPSPAVETSATIGATGDILLHSPILNDARTDEGYDFTHMFAEITGYWNNYDYMIANLEVTCGGEEAGEYLGYPAFNSPDEIVTALKNAGVDCLLTANNHSYDTGESGFFRTQEVISNAGLDHIGTRQSASDSTILIKDVEGIKFGFACYTYDTRSSTDGNISLNSNVLSDATAGLVNSFTYDDLETFYNKVSEDIQTMQDNECDVTVFFIHWGTEYQDEPNETQTTMAQELCNRGVDVIIGGHPHVIQRFDTLTSWYGDHSTLCLYSMGNALSSQRKEEMDPEETRGYTEDGLTISISYEKFNNGKVKLTGVYILPTWVDVDDGLYCIVPLEQSMITTKWQTSSLSEAIASYNRTLGRLGTVYPSLRLELGQEAVQEYIEN